MKKALIRLKKFFELLTVIILTITIIFLLLNQFFIRYSINNFIDIKVDEIIELKIIKYDINVINDENTHVIKEVYIKNDEKIKMVINRLNEIILTRDFKNELSWKLVQQATYPETTDSFEYGIYIKTLENTYIDIKLVNENTYMDLNVRELKKDIDEKQYYFKIKDGFYEKCLKEILE